MVLFYKTDIKTLTEAFLEGVEVNHLEQHSAIVELSKINRQKREYLLQINGDNLANGVPFSLSIRQWNAATQTIELLDKIPLYKLEHEDDYSFFLRWYDCAMDYEAKAVQSQQASTPPPVTE
jgi:hypothetical protein